MQLRDKKVMTFDCYGTLIDWESGVMQAMQKLGHADIYEEEVLTLFARHETKVQQEHPTWLYPQILAEVYLRLCKDLDLDSKVENGNKFGESVGDWLPFADTHDALTRLQKHYQLVVISNIDNESIAKSAKKMGVVFDQIFTAQNIGAYKPDLRVFRHVLAALDIRGIPINQVLHVAQSLYHDHKPAQELGLDGIWIDRRRGKAGSGATPMVEDVLIPELCFDSLSQFADFCDSQR